jgi:hypothetical protein
MKYLHGCNYPWSTDGNTVFYGLDFGANVWGSHLGVSTRRAAVARDFAEMAALGFTVARWFLFCDGRAGIVYDESGLPAGIDNHLFTDMDAALENCVRRGHPDQLRADSITDSSSVAFARRLRIRLQGHSWKRGCRRGARGCSCPPRDARRS